MNYENTKECLPILRRKCLEGKVIRLHDMKVLADPKVKRINGRESYDFSLGKDEKGVEKRQDYWADCLLSYVVVK